MEYKLCKDNLICCDDDCRRCANLVHGSLTNVNKKLKDENKELIDKCQELEEKLEWANEDIESLNNKHWDDGIKIVSKNQTIIKLEEKCAKLEKENNYLDQECESLLAKFSERIAELEKENHHLDKECEKLRDDNQRFAHECRYYIERESNLVTENNKLRTMNSELLYRNSMLMKTTGPVATYEPVNDAMTDEKEDTVLDAVTIEKKLQELTEDIIRLDKCLSNRQCVQLERIKEEHDGE